MKISVGDIIGLNGEISGHTVIGTGWNYRTRKFIDLSDGRCVPVSDVYVVRTDNGDGTATEIFSDGRVRTVELE